jgi:uncharacterized repeat protein (TIGR02543 family)
MRRKLINKIIACAIISTTLCTLIPIRASAEWVSDYQNNWYYTQNGQKMTGWKKIDGQLYYFDDNGKMQKGWINAGDSWYFLQNNGVLKIGWFQYNKNWYYSDSSGAIQTGTINIEGKVYIFDSNGVMKTNNTLINGEFYTIGANGEVAGLKVPTPDKEYDSGGNCLTVLKNADSKVSASPTSQSFNEVIKDESVSNDDPNQGRTFNVNFKDSNGADLKTKSIKYGKSVDLYEPTKTGYNFKNWTTKSDGSGKSYDYSDNIKVKEDINLYAQWTTDTTVYANSITVNGSSYVTAGKTSQMTVNVLPSDAANKTVTWSVTNGTGKATIDGNGVLTGTVAGTATANDGSKLSGIKVVTVSAADVVIPVDKVTVTSKTGGYEIKDNAGTLQMQASVSPTDASTPAVTWSVDNIDGTAEIDANGLITAKSNGSVAVKATASNGVFDRKEIVISGQDLTISVASIDISGSDTISTDAAKGGTNGKTVMSATVNPTYASNKVVTWKVEPYSSADKTPAGAATIDSNTGVLTAATNGYVKVTATSTETPSTGNKVYGEKIVKIENQTIKSTGIEISGNGGNEITTNAASGGTNGTLQMKVSKTIPDNASYKSIAWTVERITDNTGSATIDSNGLLTAVTNGDVIVRATVTAQDDSKFSATAQIAISGQTSSYGLTGITVSAKNNVKLVITSDDGTLDMLATLVPYYATASNVTWSVISGTGTATIDANGVLKASTNGNVRVRATATSNGKTITGETEVMLSGQFEQVTKVTISNPILQVELGGTLQMSATTLPTNAYNKSVTWEVSSGTDGGIATFANSTGLLKGTRVGTVNVRAISADQYKTASNPIEVKVVEPIKITNITLTAVPTAIAQNAGTIDLAAAINEDATNKAVTWSVEPYTGVNGTAIAGSATIVDNGDGTAKLTAITNGLVKVKATAKDSGGVSSEIVISIDGQLATALTVKGYNGAVETNQINSINGTLKIGAFVVPDNSTMPEINWTVKSGTGQATIDADGTLHGLSNGTVTVTATATTASGSKATGSAIITINGITSIVISGGPTVQKGNILQLAANILPSTIPDKTVIWSVTDNGGIGTSTLATIDTNSGILMAKSSGYVDVTATSIYDSSKKYTTTIQITE